MRFVERIEWLGGNRLAVSGSINPSTAEYVIFDVATGKDVRRFFDDGAGAAFSPDGLHAAYVTGKPHLGSDNAGSLIVDDRPIFAAESSDTVFVARPKWSPSGTMLAMLVGAADAARVLVWRSGESAAHVTSMPGADRTLFWQGEQLIARSGSSAGAAARYAEVRADGNAPTLLPVAPVADPLRRASAYRASLAPRIPDGATDANVWCRRCPLADTVGVADVSGPDTAN